jgi:hypothetical protein
MAQARDAVERRSWSHPQEPTSDDWWADVLADPRVRRRELRASDLPVRRAFYTLADEKRETCLTFGTRARLVPGGSLNNGLMVVPPSGLTERSSSLTLGDSVT